MNQFELVIRRLFAAVPSIQNQTQLAESLEIKPSSVSDAKKRGKIPPEWIGKLSGKFGLNANWLLAGEGTPFIDPHDGMSQQDFDELSRETDKYMEWAKDVMEEHHKVKKNIRECARIAFKILKSKTRYVPVLLENLRTLETAVDEETRLRRKEEASRVEREARLKRLEDDLAEIRAIIHTLSGKDNSSKPEDKE